MLILHTTIMHALNVKSEKYSSVLLYPCCHLEIKIIMWETIFYFFNHKYLSLHIANFDLGWKVRRAVFH